MTDNSDKKPHHHGDLRNALINAGLDLLEKGGIKALTLRGCAAGANVSHAAPKHHFKNVDELRDAIGGECFKMFDQFMRDAATAGPQTDKGRLKSICEGYINFALKKPAFFDAIFSNNGLKQISSDVATIAPTGYATLQSACAPFVPQGADPEITETQVWSLIHGYTLLVRMGRFSDSQSPEGPFDQVMALLDHVGSQYART